MPRNPHVDITTFTVTFESFPTSIDTICNYISSEIYQPLTDALYEMLQLKPEEPIEWIAKYMLKYNVKQPLKYSASFDTQHLIQYLKNEEKLKKSERDLMLEKQKNQQPKCGCSIMSASSLSSVWLKFIDFLIFGFWVWV